MAEFKLSPAQVHLIEEAPEYGLAQLEKSLHADMVVMGAISRSIVADVLIGSTTEKVIDYLSSDVLIVKEADFKSPLAEH